MNFLNFCAFPCISHLLLISWSIILCSLVDFSSGVILIITFLPIMPVLTRSRAKQQTLTGSTDGSLQFPSGTGSTDELLIPNITTGSTDATVLSISNKKLLSSSNTNFVPSFVVNLPLSTTPSMTLGFQDSSPDGNNLKISKNSSFEILSFPTSTVSLSHNSSVIKIENMEDDCDDGFGLRTSSPQVKCVDFMQFFATFSNQLSTHMDHLHSRLTENDEKLWYAQTTFHKEVRQELEELRSLLPRLTHTSSNVTSNVPVSNVTLPIDTSSPLVPASHTISSPIVSAPSSTSSTSATVTDLQAQMMLLLTESFTKLSTALADPKSQESKTEWPKFSGDAKKFRSWYLSVMAQLSIHPWSEFYDASTNSAHHHTNNSSLNGKLYAKLISVLDGQALQDMISRSHLRANGLLLLQELVETYKPTNVPEVLAAKAGEFWSKMKRGPHETVDSYYNRFCELLDDLDQAEDKISTKSAMRHFIFTLGSEFESIQHNYRIGNLPLAWNTTDWPSLLVLCRNYYNSVNPKGPASRDRDSPTENHNQRMAQQKKVKEWFLNPVKFCKEIEQEQLKYPDKSIYHLTKSHPTADCNVKHECDRLWAQRTSTSSRLPLLSQIQDIMDSYVISLMMFLKMH